MKIIIAHFLTHWVDTSGGVEKVICNFANAMVARGHDVTILYIDSVEGPSYFHLDNRVKTINVLFENGKKIISEKLPLYLRIYRELSRCIWGLRKVQAINADYKGKLYGNRIKKYFQSYSADIVIACSGQSIKYTIVDAACPYPVVGMIHSDITKSFPLLSKAEIDAMKKCQAVQILMDSWTDIAQTYLGQVPVIAIGNVVEHSEWDASPGIIKENYVISCVGNVSKRKNQKFLVDVWARLAKDYPNWSIDIWGDYDSPYGAITKKYLESKRLEGCIHLKGKTSHIDKVYANSDIFVIPSHSEGFPLALTEAMAAGLPAIGFKTCGGVNGLIKDNKTGYLTDSDVEAFSEALKTLMDHTSIREQMGKAGQQEMKRYAPEIIWNKWENLLKKYVGNGG